MSEGSVFDDRQRGQLDLPRPLSFHDVAARIAEAERRTEHQERLIESQPAKTSRLSVLI